MENPSFNISDVAFFFLDPNIPPTKPGAISNLHALRRDVDFVMGIDRATGLPIPDAGRALWSGTITIMAGIDLLAKCLDGDDEDGKVGFRFKAFIERYFGVDQDTSAIIFELRNSLMHSYSLKLKHERHEIGTMFGIGFPLTVEPQPRALIKLLNLFELYSLFESAIPKYRADLDKHENLRQNFAKMFPKYGKFYVS